MVTSQSLRNVDRTSKRTKTIWDKTTSSSLTHTLSNKNWCIDVSLRCHPSVHCFVFCVLWLAGDASYRWFDQRRASIFQSIARTWNWFARYVSWTALPCLCHCRKFQLLRRVDWFLGNRIGMIENLGVTEVYSIVFIHLHARISAFFRSFYLQSVWILFAHWFFETCVKSIKTNS